ncbi:MAG: hypothetical protein HY744_22770 [Deltaproteobacteria bacterium]|nr:hypothetical protein [Deltaproteobacteria bacterium]
MIKTNQQLPSGPLETVARYLALVDAAAPDGFVPLASFADLEDGAAVERDSQLWAGRFFRPEASPWRDGLAVTRAAHRARSTTQDLLRHGYRLEELQIAVFESAAFVLVRIAGPLPGAGDDATAAAIARLADRVLARSGAYDDVFGQRVPYEWRFQYQAPLGEGARLSTAPDADPMVLSSWAARVDGGIHRGELFLLGYKARASGDGRLVFLDGRHWFDGKCWEPYVGRSR